MATLRLLAGIAVLLHVSALALPETSAVASLGNPEQLTSDIRPPFGNSIFLTLRGVGNQIYRCQETAGDWSYSMLRAAADLSFLKEDTVVGYHYFQSRVDALGGRPTWSISSTAGDSAMDVPISTVTAKIISSRPNGAMNVADLLLKATSHSGNGNLSRVSYIQRRYSQAGVPPSSCSRIGKILKVPYEARYVFWVQDGFIPSTIPSDLLVPKGHTPVASAYGEGFLNYRFNGSDWIFLGAKASLSYIPGQEPWGIHFFLQERDSHGGQASWEMSTFSSRVTAKQLQAASVDPKSIKWSLFQGTSYGGTSCAFRSVTYVQMVSTVGGLPPQTAESEHTGTEFNSPYSAVYWFYMHDSSTA